jgi:hypothetical protein
MKLQFVTHIDPSLLPLESLVACSILFDAIIVQNAQIICVGKSAVCRVKDVGGVNCNHSYLRVNYLCDNAVYRGHLTITSTYPAPAMDMCTVDKRLVLTLFPIHGALPDVY